MTTSTIPTKTLTQPEYLVFECPLTIEAAGDADTQAPKFSMVAYTGGVMRISGFPHPVVVDLEGLAIDRQDIPVRLDHNPRQGVGHTQRVTIEQGQVVAEGVVSRDTTWARDVAKSGVKGFPWQASIGAAVVDAEFIPNGQSVTVNGRSFNGPLHIVRQAILKEISFVDSGADAATSARIAAMQSQSLSLETPSMTTQQNNTSTTSTATNTIEADSKPNDEGTANKMPQSAVTPKPATPATVNASATVHANASTDPADPVHQLRQRVAAETRRIESIQKICTTDTNKHADIQAKAIEEGWDETKTELAILRASRPQVSPALGSNRPRNTTPQVFEAVGLMASGCPNTRIEALYSEPILEAADKL